MDNIERLFEVQRDERESNLVRLLDPAKLSGDEMKWMWDHIATQEYAFDDFSRGKAEWFAMGLAEANSLHFLVEDLGYMIVRNAIEAHDCNLHFVVWGDRDIKRVAAAGKEVLNYLFNTVKVQRITGFIPKFNISAKRFAVVTGFKYEGCIRKSVLWKGKFYDIEVYGMLKDEFSKRGVN